MADINILSPHLADLIAAGEVVERPASVVKELLENAFDAGAKNITVEIKGGGMAYIRVTDDGVGMLPEDAGVCFLRHATSKLRDERGLESIGTMGFRGEALAAIASVSRVELITRRRGEEAGTRLLLEAGEILEMTPFGCPEGTSIVIRDLFFNTPARLRFMKADRAEGSACLGLALRCALGRPETSVRFLKDGAEEFFSPGDGKSLSAVYSLLGRELSQSLLDCALEEDGLSVTGFAGSPALGHGNRGKQFFFVNGRSIRSPLLQAAVEQAYKNSLLTGRYPACVIYLNLSFGAVDVNVHPAKLEIKFREEKRVFDAVYYAVLAALEAERPAPEISLSPAVRAAAAPKKDFFQTMDAKEFRSKFSEAPKPAAPVPQSVSRPVDRGTILWDRTPPASATGDRVSESRTTYGLLDRLTEPEAAAPAPPPLFEPLPPAPVNASLVEQRRVEPPAPASVEASLSEAVADFRLIGETMKTYILAETAEGLLLIDKHAAHERMIFDRLKSQGQTLMSQQLLEPVPLRLSGEELELLEQNGEALSALGFEIEPFGSDTVILRGLPADTDAGDARAMVEEILELLKTGAPLSETGGADEILHTIACKAAIKAGWNTQRAELEALVKEVVAGRIKYCPHGRPVSATLTRKQLDKEFSRIV